MRATAIATPNIAIIKYWGKRNESLKLPINDSVSVTLGSNFQSKTTAEFSNDFEKDSMKIDGAEATEKEMKNVSLVLDYLRKNAGIQKKARIISENNFPKASGIASSASGYAALSVAASAALNLKLDSKELSIAARLGSGSASRSVLGGFVQWKKGQEEDGSDSYAEQIADENHWKEFRVISAIVSEAPKIIGSTEGMKRTAETSRLYQQRLKMLPEITEKAIAAVREKDSESLFKIAMAESNSLHAVMLDSWPPIIYLNDTSKKIISAIHSLNDSAGKTIAAYSFDAGPNAHIFTLEKNAGQVMDSLNGIEGIAKTYTSIVGKGPEVMKE